MRRGLWAEGRTCVKSWDKRECGECEGQCGCSTEVRGHNSVLPRCEACFCGSPSLGQEGEKWHLQWSLPSSFYLCCLRSDSELEADRYTKTKVVLWSFIFKENIWLWNTVPSPKSSPSLFVTELLCMGIPELGSGMGEGNSINFPILYLGYLLVYRGRL